MLFRVPGDETVREMKVLVGMVFALLLLLGAVWMLRWRGGGLERAGEEVPTEPEFAPAGEFEPLEKLDREFIEDYTWDYTQQLPGAGRLLEPRKFRREAHRLDYEALLHAIRYLRTLEKSGRQPEGGYRTVSPQDYLGMIKTPYRYRGRPVAILGRFQELYGSYRLAERDYTRAAGTERISCVYFRGVEMLRAPHLRDEKLRLGYKTEPMVYLVVSPYDLRPFLRKKLVFLRGIFVRRWPPDPERDYWLPVIVTLVPEEQAVPEDTSGWALRIVLAVVVVLVGVLALVGQRDRAARRRRRRRPPAAGRPGAGEGPADGGEEHPQGARDDATGGTDTG